MTIPDWAHSEVSNYRAAYKEVHGVEYTGTDERIHELCEKWKPLGSIEEEDNAILYEMHNDMRSLS